MWTHLCLSTPRTAAPHVPRPHQSIPHNVIQLLGNGHGLLSQLVAGRLLLASVVVGTGEVGWLPLVIATWSGMDHLLGDQVMQEKRQTLCVVSQWMAGKMMWIAIPQSTLSLLQCGHFWTSNKIRIVANKLRMLKKMNLTSLLTTNQWYPQVVGSTDWL